MSEFACFRLFICVCLCICFLCICVCSSVSVCAFAFCAFVSIHLCLSVVFSLFTYVWLCIFLCVSICVGVFMSAWVICVFVVMPVFAGVSVHLCVFLWQWNCLCICACVFVCACVSASASVFLFCFFRNYVVFLCSSIYGIGVCLFVCDFVCLVVCIRGVCPSIYNFFSFCDYIFICSCVDLFLPWKYFILCIWIMYLFTLFCTLSACAHEFLRLFMPSYRVFALHWSLKHLFTLMY